MVLWQCASRCTTYKRAAYAAELCYRWSLYCVSIAKWEWCQTFNWQSQPLRCSWVDHPHSFVSITNTVHFDTSCTRLGGKQAHHATLCPVSMSKAKAHNTVTPQAAYCSCSAAFVSQSEQAYSPYAVRSACAHRLWPATKQPYAALVCRLMVLQLWLVAGLGIGDQRCTVSRLARNDVTHAKNWWCLAYSRFGDKSFSTSCPKIWNSLYSDSPA